MIENGRIIMVFKYDERTHMDWSTGLPENKLDGNSCKALLLARLMMMKMQSLRHNNANKNCRELSWANAFAP